MGQRILRVEDDRFLRGNGLYVENQDVPGALHATFVRSPVAHARIVGIDTSAVASVPGVGSPQRTSTSGPSRRRRCVSGNRRSAVETSNTNGTFRTTNCDRNLAVW